jgi:LPXTG-motif cell wall-anchored protein
MLSPSPGRSEHPHIRLFLDLSDDYNQRRAGLRLHLEADPPATDFIVQPPIPGQLAKADGFSDLCVTGSVFFIADLGLNVGMGQEFRHPWSMVAHPLASSSQGLVPKGRSAHPSTLTQAYFEAHGGSPSNNVDNLDADHDGQACEAFNYGSTSPAVSPVSSSAPSQQAATESLPRTGASGTLAPLGVALVLIGGVAVLVSRRRRRAVR